MAELEWLSIEEANQQFSYDHDTGIISRLVPKAAGKVGPVGIKPTVNGYIHVSCKGQKVLQHRLAWLLMTGAWPTDEIDHINGIKTDNRWENLRSVSSRGNKLNRQRQQNNKSGVNGVHWHKPANKWRAVISINRKPIYIGIFDDIRDAEAARKRAEEKYGFHKNHGRLA